MNPELDLAEVRDLLHRPDWHARAACRGVPLAVFFPEKGHSSAAAKAVCARCPACAECLADAVADAEREGVWGQTTKRERVALRRSSAAPRHFPHVARVSVAGRAQSGSTTVA